jgi:4,5-dihydroxyphthalate decarboxylase
MSDKRSANLTLRLGSPVYDRTEPLQTGEVKPEGIDLVYLQMPPAEAHARMLRSSEFDVSEMSMSFYMMAKLSGKASFTAIPIFPMRSFFHTKVVVNPDSGIHSPADMKGKRFGVQEYGMTLALWLRGVFRHEYGIDPTDLEWYFERNQQDSVGNSIGFKPPDEVRAHQISPDTDLMTMLAHGEIDAAFPYPDYWRTSRDRRGNTSRQRVQKVEPLFSDPKAEAKRYFAKTGFFPINHVIVVRDEILNSYPWVAQSLFEAFSRAKEVSYSRSAKSVDQQTNFVWLDSLFQEVSDVFNGDPYPYGIEANRKILDAMAAYSFEQELTPHKATLEELFVPSTLVL